MIYQDYAIFTPGPVKMSEKILKLGAQQTPYFRNSEFSNITFDCEKNLLEMVNAPEGSRVVFLTASGTAGMEATVMNLLTQNDKALVINGGGFGARFVKICQTHAVPHHELKVKDTNLSDIAEIAPQEKFTSLVVNAHETSVGPSMTLMPWVTMPLKMAYFILLMLFPCSSLTRWTCKNQISM